MACRGVHFALDETQRGRLLEVVESHGDVVEFIQEEIEEAWDEAWLCQTDKAWDAIHRCLTDGTLSTDDSTSLHWCVLGGRQLDTGDDYFVSFVDAADAKLVADAIEPFTEAEFRSRYERIDPVDYGMPLDDDDFEYTWENFVDLRNFFRKAATGGRAVIFTVDQ